MSFYKISSIFLAPILSLLVWLLPLNLDPAAHKLAGIMTWTVVWWVFGTFPLHIVGIVAASISVVLQISDAKTVFASFSHPVIFLFMGGFFLAKAMEVNNLDKRIALTILKSKYIDGNGNRLFLAILFITSILSMWLSNTATTAIMLPIALGVTSKIEEFDEKHTSLFLLSIAYAATIGGLGTPVGSPPNLLVITFLRELLGIEISFLGWMIKAIPVLTICFIILYFVFKRKIDLPKKINTDHFDLELARLGPLNFAQKTTIVIISLTIVLWLLPGFSKIFMGASHPVSLFLKNHLSEAVVAILMASFLFFIPDIDGRKTILSWDHAKNIDWGTLLLFGSGIALGSLMFKTGLAQVIGNLILSNTANLSNILLLFILVTFSLFFTEIVSNTASANLLLPIFITSLSATGKDPVTISLAMAMACNLAFMLPVATPPNAIVFGSKLVDSKDMLQKGLILNILCSIVLTLVGIFLF